MHVRINKTNSADKRSKREDMAETEDVQVSFPGGKPNEEPEPTGGDYEETTDRGPQNNFMNTLRSIWQDILIGILLVLLCSLSALLLGQLHKQQVLTAELQEMAEDTKQVQIENSQLKELLNSTNQNFTLLEADYSKLKLLTNATVYNFTLLSAENTQLGLLLKNTSQEETQLRLLLENAIQEKAQLEEETNELKMFQNSTLENCRLVEEENNEPLHNITLASDESKQLRLLLNKEQQSSMQLEAESQHLRSILFSDNLSFLWRFCNRSTLQCSRCLSGWVEHASRCFFLSQEKKEWEDARRECLDMGGDLAVVLSADDQAFFTHMTFEFRQQHPQNNFHSAWIGLQDMVEEDTFIWVSGNRIQPDVMYWRHQDPNNVVASWDKDQEGQDCVAIVPPRHHGQEDWMKSWDDIVCVGERNFLCETMALGLA